MFVKSVFIFVFEFPGPIIEEKLAQKIVHGYVPLSIMTPDKYCRHDGSSQSKHQRIIKKINVSSIKLRRKLVKNNQNCLSVSIPFEIVEQKQQGAGSTIAVLLLLAKQCTVREG